MAKAKETFTVPLSQIENALLRELLIDFLQLPQPRLATERHRQAAWQMLNALPALGFNTDMDMRMVNTRNDSHTMYSDRQLKALRRRLGFDK